MIETVKIKEVRHKNGGCSYMPVKKSTSAAAFDCYVNEPVVVTDQPTLVGLGFAMELPEGYHAEIVPRSSTGLNTDLRMPNSIGIIDSDYRGEVKGMFEVKQPAPPEGFWKRLHWLLFGGKKNAVRLAVGMRICQMLIKKDEAVHLMSATKLSNTNRGTGGFGSTGYSTGVTEGKRTVIYTPEGEAHNG